MLSAACSRNQASQFVPTYLVTPALDRSHNHSYSLILLTAICSRASATLPRRSNMPNPDHARDTCYNCSKVGHCLPDYG